MARMLDKSPPRRPDPRPFRVKLGARGRIVLPAELRKALELQEGDALNLVLFPDERWVKLISKKEALDQSMGMWAHLAPPDVLLSEELIADRRAEAAREAAEE